MQLRKNLTFASFNLDSVNLTRFCEFSIFNPRSSIFLFLELNALLLVIKIHDHWQQSLQIPN